MSQLDCIIVGYNDVDFSILADRQKRMAKRSGGYHEIKTNSFLINGKRIPYMDYLNEVIEKSTGQSPGLNVFKAPSLGAVYLKNYLQKRDYQTEVINCFTFEKEKLKELLTRHSPISVAITTTFYVDAAPITEVVKFIRSHNTEVKIIVGGPHIYNLEGDLDQETLDYIYRSIGGDIFIIDSQGEQTLGRVMEALQPDSTTSLGEIPNLCYQDHGGKWVSTERKPENNDLDDNSIDWSSFDPDLVTPIAYLRTARSCPFKCTFCNYPTMAGAHVVSSVDLLEEELRRLHAMGTTHVVFIDDTFNVPLPRFKNLLRMMIRNQFNFQWVSFLRCANADEETFDLMKESGCSGVLLGIESGDQQMLKYMNKAATLARYRWGIGELNKRGITSFVSLITGFPGETEQTVKKTIEFIDETKPTFFNAQLYYHDLRAPIHKQADKFGIQGAGYNWSHNSMNWVEAADWATYTFKTIKNSIPLGLYGFSLWGVSYLLAQGVTMDQVKEFGRITSGILINSLEEKTADYSDKEAQLVELFRHFQPFSNDKILVPA